MTIVASLLNEGGTAYDSVVVRAEINGPTMLLVARGYKTEPGVVPAIVEVPLAIQVRLA